MKTIDTKKIEDLKRVGILADLMASGQANVLKHLFEMETKLREAIDMYESTARELKETIDDKRALDGYSPVLGIDYFTEEEVGNISKKIKSELKDEIQKSIILPKAGKDFPTRAEILEYIVDEIEKSMPEAEDDLVEDEDYVSMDNLEELKKEVNVLVSDLKKTLDPSSIKNDLLKSTNLLEQKINQIETRFQALAASGRGGGPVNDTKLKEGSNITITKDASGAWVISSTASSSGSTNIYSEVLAQVDLSQSGNNVTYAANNLANTPINLVLNISRNGIEMIEGDTDNGYTTSNTGNSMVITFYNAVVTEKFKILYTY